MRLSGCFIHVVYVMQSDDVFLNLSGVDAWWSTVVCFRVLTCPLNMMQNKSCIVQRRVTPSSNNNSV